MILRPTHPDLHGPDAAVGHEGDWYACDFPEHPHDGDHTVYFSECLACAIALDAASRHCPYAGCDFRTPDDPDGHRAWTTAEAHAEMVRP